MRAAEEVSRTRARKWWRRCQANGNRPPTEGSRNRWVEIGQAGRVQVVTATGDAWGSMLTVLSPVGVAGVVLVFTVFILLRLEDLRNRFIRLVGHNHLNLMTQALDDASQRIGKYLLLQFIVNTSYGIIIGAGLHFIGLPNALLWGVLAAAFRFLPLCGPPIAAIMPIVLSLAVFTGGPELW